MKRWVLWLLLATFTALSCKPAAIAPPTGSPPSSPPRAREDPEPWRNAVPEPGPPGRLLYPTPSERDLTNGMKVFTVRLPAHVVALVVVVRRGGSSVALGKSGLAALTARMLTEGTKFHSSEELALAAEDLGSQLEADAGRDYSYVAMTVLREDLDEAVKLLAEVTREPAFDANELRRVRSEWVDGLLAQRQSPDRLASLAALRVLLGPEHGSPVGGSVPDVRALTSRDLAEFYESHYAPSETALIAVGDIDQEEVADSATRHFGTWQAEASANDSSDIRPSLPKRRRLVLIDRPEATQSALCLVQRFPPRGAAHHEAREVLNTALGGMFTSRLMQNLREEHGYTYGAGSVAVATRRWGAYIAMTTVEADSTKPAIEEILRELENVTSDTSPRPLSDEELDRAKTTLINEQAAQLESVGSIALDTATLFVDDLPLDYYATYEKRIREVTRETVVGQARTYLRPNQVAIVVVGPRSRIEPGLRNPHQTVETAHPSLLE